MLNVILPEFDTHQYVKILVKAGVPEVQAEAQLEANKLMMQTTLTNHVATKDDIRNSDVKIEVLRQEMHKEFHVIRQEINQRFSQIDQRFSQIDQRIGTLETEVQKIKAYGQLMTAIASFIGIVNFIHLFLPQFHF